MGRISERAHIRRLLAEAREGHGRVLLVHGEAGIGKTVLLQDAAAQALGIDSRADLHQLHPDHHGRH